MKHRTIIVAGASGMLGSALVDRFLGLGHQVIALYRPNRPGPRISSEDRGNLSRIELPSFESDLLQRALAGASADILVNCAGSGVNPAARDSDSLWAGNAKLIRELVRFAAAAGIPRVIHTGSESEYARAPIGLPMPESHPIRPFTEYGAAKAASVADAGAFAEMLGLDLMVLRPFYVFGPREAPHRLLPSIAAAGRTGRSMAMSPGDQLRDFLYVDDAAEAYVAAIDCPWPGRVTVCNLCSGVARSVRDVGDLAAARFGLPPGLLQWGAVPYRETDAPWIVGDPRRLQEITGWRPALTIEQGIERWKSAFEAAR